jgi:hypothetical protein
MAEPTSRRATIVNTVVIILVSSASAVRRSIRLASANGARRGVATPGVESVQLGRDRPSNLRFGSGYATHAVAQMRRAVAQRGLDREPIEARAEQRFPEVFRRRS